jgi:hypothetical protein
VVRDKFTTGFYKNSINLLAKEMYCRDYDGILLRLVFPVLALISVITASIRLCYRVFSKVRIPSFGENLVSAIFFFTVALMVLIGLVLFISKVKREEFEKELSFVVYDLVSRGLVEEIGVVKHYIGTSYKELIEDYPTKFSLSDITNLEGITTDKKLFIEVNTFGVVIVDDRELRRYLGARPDVKYGYFKKILNNWEVVTYNLQVDKKIIQR